jgi:NADPH:quinone reductase
VARGGGGQPHRAQREQRPGGLRAQLQLKDGNRIREQLLTLDDRAYKSTYCIVEATVPLQRYVATVTLKPVTDGDRTFWHWESSFATPPGMERELREMVATGVYEAGFENLRRHLREGTTCARGAARRCPPRCRMPCAARGAAQLRRAEVLQAETVDAPPPAQARCASASAPSA